MDEPGGWNRDHRMNKVFIVAAGRTPQGRFLGALAKRSAVDLAKDSGRELLKMISPDAIDQVIIGNVLGAGQGMNIARQVGVGLNIPIDRPAGPGYLRLSKSAEIRSRPWPGTFSGRNLSGG